MNIDQIKANLAEYVQEQGEDITYGEVEAIVNFLEWVTPPSYPPLERVK
jgi:hypothetical protein